MSEWLVGVWHQIWLHREGIFGGTAVAFIAFLLGTMKWWYEVKKLRREERAVRLESKKALVLNFLRHQMAYTGLNGQTVEQVSAGINLSKKETASLLHDLANESPVKTHTLGKRWFLGPFPVEAFRGL
jgi:hypothetical protein